MCAVLSALVPDVASAQQGSVQVTAAGQSVHGDPRRIGEQPPFEPDFGVSWLQPGTRFGLFQIELRGTRRGDLPHLGKVSVSARDLKYRAQFGRETYFSPAIGDYRFANLSTPALTFVGGALAARSPRATAGLLVGRTTAMAELLRHRSRHARSAVGARTRQLQSDRSARALHTRFSRAHRKPEGSRIHDRGERSGRPRRAMDRHTRRSPDRRREPRLVS